MTTIITLAKVVRAKMTTNQASIARIRMLIITTASNKKIAMHKWI